ncbi:DinB family protein [Methylomarinum vadi]|uniref:DinB family protein n=1 Tax=Methylomarinum vadi TaxID=438855 RepID=UPI0004DF0A6F|nr:DinB family protein [Methylomarinum vadi]
MKMIDYFYLQHRYSAWVNERLYAVCHKMSDRERKRDLGAFFHSLHGTLNHLLLVDRLWLYRLTGQPVSYLTLDQKLYADFANLHAAQRTTDTELGEFLRGLDEEILERRIGYVSLSTGQEKSLPVQTMLTTLFMHKIHHRGQVSALISQLGYDYGGIDFICAPFVS